MTLQIYVKKNKAIISLEREPIHGKRYNDNLCFFRCLALHRGGDVRRLEPTVKTLYKAYNQNNIILKEEFAGVMLEELYRIESTFETNVCVYKLVKSDDAEDGKSTAELVRRSLCHYPETMYLNFNETHFTFIQDVRMYCHSYRCAMLNILRSMSDAAYEGVLSQLAQALTNWDERMHGAQSPDDDEESGPPTNPYKTLMRQLYGWMHQLPIIGFNSGKYDFNAVKQFLIPYFLSTSKT